MSLESETLVRQEHDALQGEAAELRRVLAEGGDIAAHVRVLLEQGRTRRELVRLFSNVLLAVVDDPSTCARLTDGFSSVCSHVHRIVAQHLARLGRTEEAGRYLDQALAEKEEAPYGVHNSVIETLFLLGRSDEAYQWVEQCLTPGGIKGATECNGIACNLARAGHRYYALRIWRKILQHFPSDPDVAKWYARFRQEFLGEMIPSPPRRDGSSTLTMTHQRDPMSPFVLRPIRLAQGRPEALEGRQAQDDKAQGDTGVPSRTPAERLKAAEEQWEREGKNHPANTKSYQQYLQVVLKHGTQEQLLVAFRKVLEASDSHGVCSCCMNMARNVAGRGEVQRAINLWAVILEFHHDASSAFATFMKKVRKKAEKDGQTLSLSQMPVRFPEVPHVLHDRTIERPPPLPQPKSKYQAATELRRAGEFSKAVQVWFPLAEKDAKACARFASELMRRGKIAEAIELWDAIFTVNPRVGITDGGPFLQEHAEPGEALGALSASLPNGTEEQLTPVHRKVLTMFALIARRGGEELQQQLQDLLSVLVRSTLLTRGEAKKLGWEGKKARASAKAH